MPRVIRWRFRRNGSPLHSPRPTRAAWLLALLGLVMLAALVAHAAWPGSWVPSPVRSFFAADAAWSLTLVILVLGASAAAYWWPHRRGRRSFAVLVSLALGAITLPLGMASYWRCTGDQATFWTPLSWTLALFVGNVEDPFGETAGGCASAVPLALQLGRLTALAAVFASAAAVLSALFRSQWDRLRARAARSVVLLTGLDAATALLVTHLRAKTPPSCTVTVIVQDPGSAAAREARAGGAVVVPGDPADGGTLLTVVRSGRSSAARTAYLLSPSAPENLRVLAALEHVVGGLQSPQDALVPRFVVRLDDPWQTEDWRRQQSGRTRDWVVDAVGVHEATARMLADRIRAQGRRVVVVGSSALSLALLGELAQHERESRFLSGGRARPVFDAITVVDPDAMDVVTDHARMQLRVGDPAGQQIDSVAEHATIARISELVGATPPGERSVVVFTDAPTHALTGLATRTAVRHEQQVHVLARTPEGASSSPTAVLHNLVAYGLALAHDGRLPEDSWERAARLLHDKHLRDHPPGPQPKLAQLPWNELSDYYKQDNLRQIRSTLRRAVEQGRTWQVLPAVTEEMPFTPAELQVMAAAEHDEWMDHRLRNGWSYGAVRDDAALRHDMLLPFDQLNARTADLARRYTEEGLVKCLSLLRSLGYRPVIDPAVWRTYGRLGDVSAERLDKGWTWTTGAGEELVARAGDWRVTAANGEQWSVAADVFASSYAHVGGDHYRRTGVVSARRATAGETVVTMEGTTRAREGDRLVRGAAGELWLVPAERFAASYVPLDEDAATQAR